MSKISFLIRKYRFINELTQKEFAAMCHISQNHLSQIETGKKEPSLDVYLRMCKTIKICPHTLDKCNIL